MAKYGVVRTDNMFGTDNRSGLVSVRYMGSDGNKAAAIENGSVVKIGSLVEGEREVFVGADVASDDKISDVVLIAAPEVAYDERVRNLDEYINEEGKNIRGYHLHTGDTFSVTKEALVGVEAPAKGNVVELANGTKLSVAAAETDATKVGTIIDVEIAGRYTYYVILVA